MKKLILLMLFVILAMPFLFSMDIPDKMEMQIDQGMKFDTLIDSSVISPIAETNNLLSDSVASILATLLYALIGWICFIVQKYLKIKVMKNQVIGFIIRQAEELENQKHDNDIKRKIVVSEIKKNKNLTKWTKILYGGLDEAVSTVYKQFVKNSLKNVVKQINKLG